MKRTMVMLTLAAAPLVFALGCVVEEPPPRRVVYVEGPPPAQVVEVVPAQPAPDMIWIGGVWVHEGRYWTWRRGYWDHRR